MADYSKLAAKCVARFEDRDYVPGGPPVYAWHVHHGVLLEPLIEPVANRVQWILDNKPAREIATRLEWLRPLGGVIPCEVAEALAKYDEARAKYDEALAKSTELRRLHEAELPGCPWDGTTLLFPQAEAATKEE